MNKTLLAVFVIGIIAVAAYFFTRPDQASPTSSASPSPSATVASPTNSPSQATNQAGNPGTYVAYNADIIAQTSGTKVLFFHAPWCPQCRALEKSINEGPIPEGVTIIKVDYDSNQALRQKYGVTIQTTLVRVDDSGNLAEKYVAYDKPTLQALKDNLL